LTTEELNSLARNTLFVEALAQRVVDKLLARMKQILVVYTGSMIGAKESLEAMARLRADGFTFRVLVTQSAARLLDTEAIRTALEPEELWISTPDDAPEVLAARYDTIVVPATTVRTASHVAACLPDTPADALILNSLMRGKNVIMAIDGCCPDNSERAKKGYAMTEPLKQTLRDHMETLRSYGARLTTAERLDVAVKRTIQKSLTSAKASAPAEGKGEAKPAAAAAQPATAGTVRISGHVISAQKLATCPSNGTAVVESHALVTQMAVDEARRRGITIRKET
jgi:hypothetical protein